jgi:hypothetical protein
MRYDPPATGSVKPVKRWRLPLSEASLPDKYMTWVMPAIRRGKRLLDMHKFDLIYSSSGPPSSALVAWRLQKYACIPWIAEFRDLWSENPYDESNRYLKKMNEYIELRVLRQCACLVTVSEPQKDQLQRMHGKDVYVVYNGYDQDDYPETSTLTDKFTITYTGKIYLGKRDPSSLFKALSLLDDEGIINADSLVMRYYGSDNDIIAGIAAKYGVTKYIHHGGVISYRESLQRQSESWMLLLLEYDHVCAEGTLPGKFFEYLGSRRPILCCGYEKGVIKTIISDTQAGIVTNNPEVIKSLIMKCMTYYRRRDKQLGFNMDEDAIMKYTRRTSALKLSQIISRYV